MFSFLKQFLKDKSIHYPFNILNSFDQVFVLYML